MLVADWPSQSGEPLGHLPAQCIQEALCCVGPPPLPPAASQYHLDVPAPAASTTSTALNSMATNLQLPSMQ